MPLATWLPIAKNFRRFDSAGERGRGSGFIGQETNSARCEQVCSHIRRPSAIRAALVLEIVLHVKHLTIYETNVRLHVLVVRRVLFENLMRERCTLAPGFKRFRGSESVAADCVF